MTPAHLQQWMNHPECLDRDTLYSLRMLLMRYPYCQSLRLLYLKNLYLLHDDSFGAELRKSVPYVADTRMLFYLIEGERYVLQPQQPAPSEQTGDNESGTDRTLALIDAFLATQPDELPAAAAAPLQYGGDYTAYLLEQVPDVSEAIPLRGQELIDDFIQQSDAEEQKSEQPLPEEPDEPQSGEEASDEPAPAEAGADEECFTETLAKIYIKQHRYEKALAIIRKLSLNYPKKNAYFADQIRFLEKLIINAKSK